MNLDIPAGMLVNGTTALYTFTTLGYAPFVQNLHASLLRFEPQLASSLIVFCADEATERAFDSTGIFTINCGAADLPEFVEFENSGFGQVVSYKYRLAQALLRQARYAWWWDGDIVVRAPVAERVDALVRSCDCDLLMQHEWPGDVHNVGFWIARRTASVEKMLSEMIDYTSLPQVGDDQAYFNEVVVGRDDLEIKLLDHDEFMCGNRFYYTQLTGEPAGRVLHFNYTIGRRSKKALMLEHGRWYLPEPRRTRCAARLRHVVVALALRCGLNPLGGDVGVDVPGPRERLRRVGNRIRTSTR